VRGYQLAARAHRRQRPAPAQRCRVMFHSRGPTPASECRPAESVGLLLLLLLLLYRSTMLLLLLRMVLHCTIFSMPLRLRLRLRLLLLPRLLLNRCSMLLPMPLADTGPRTRPRLRPSRRRRRRRPRTLRRTDYTPDPGAAWNARGRRWPRRRNRLARPIGIHLAHRYW
jgi:hypothetical protein